MMTRLHQRLRTAAALVGGGVACYGMWQMMTTMAKPFTAVERYGLIGIAVLLLTFAIAGIAAFWAQARPVDNHHHDDARALRFGIVGSAAVCVGVFMPLVGVSIPGGTAYISSNSRLGVILLVFAAISALAVVRGLFRVLWLAAIASAGMAFLAVRNTFSAAGFQIQWGLAFIFLGSLLMLIGAHLGAPSRVSAGIERLVTRRGGVTPRVL